MIGKPQNMFLAALLFLPVPTIFAQITFTKDSTSAIFTDGGTSRGSSWGDFDNDDDVDLYVTNTGTFGTVNQPIVPPFEKNFLYINNGLGSFRREKDIDIVKEEGNSQGSSWGDYDNDGHLDLYIANGFQGNSFLYRNNGDGSFFPISGYLAGSSDEFESFGTAWSDYDNDGDLDLFVANRGNNYLYENLGYNGAGEIAWDQSGIFTDGLRSRGCSWADFDNDGDLDLFVANGNFQNNHFYENNGDGSFTPISGDIVNNAITSYSASWGDFDNDGDLDLFVTNQFSNNSLYRNNSDGSFTDIAQGDIAVSGGQGSTWGDYDNDGDLDLFLANTNGNNVLLENNGDPQGTGEYTFTRITEGKIVNDGGISNSASNADIDNDGDLDIFVANGYPEQQPNFLYINDGNNNNNWINIRCVGTFSNRSAIGAKVRIKATIDGKPVWQMREISAQTGYISQNDMRAAFGLGNAAIVDTIRIEWPSGQIQLKTDVAVRQHMTIPEAVPVEVPKLPPVEVGSEIVVVAQDTVGTISEISLQYRSAGGGGFTTTSMSDLGGGLFQGTIPGSEVTSNGVDYQLVITDNVGRSARLPSSFSYSVRVHASAGISTGQAQPDGSAQSAYRIFSVPLELDDASPIALLVDDMGEYDETRWRFLEYIAENNSYIEFPEISDIDPGKGYWFLVSEPARMIDTGAGTTNATDEAFAIGLIQGWNLIGNPFNFQIPVQNLRLKGGNTVVLRKYAISWNDPIIRPTEAIMPFEGYAINSLIASDTLFINPHIATSGPSKRTSLQKAANTIQWSIRIIAQSQEARDADNVLGVGLLASDAWDELDFPEPPPVGEYVSVYFSHTDWGMQSEAFSTDFRPEFGEGAEWKFEVKSNISDQVKLTFADIEQVPLGFDVWLVDESLNVTQNLREQNHFYLASPGVEHPKRLKLLIGSNDFVGQNIASVQLIPTDYELSQNFPNPFNPVTTIRYGLPSVSRVTLKVYNLAGNEVATLVNNEQEIAGYHVAIWDGRSANGVRVSSGVYFIRMQAEKFVQTRKILMIQ